MPQYIPQLNYGDISPFLADSWLSWLIPGSFPTGDCQLPPPRQDTVAIALAYTVASIYAYPMLTQTCDRVCSQPCLRREHGQASRSWFSPQYIAFGRYCFDGAEIYTLNTDRSTPCTPTTRLLPQCVSFQSISMHTGLLSVCLVLSSLTIKVEK
jgi:hypothetical protein